MDRTPSKVVENRRITPKRPDVDVDVFLGVFCPSCDRELSQDGIVPHQLELYGLHGRYFPDPLSHIRTSELELAAQITHFSTATSDVRRYAPQNIRTGIRPLSGFRRSDVSQYDLI